MSAVTVAATPARGARSLTALVAAVGVAVASIVIAPGVPVVGAAGGITVTPNPVSVASNSYTEATVNWSGQPAGKLVFIGVCVKSTRDPDFQVGVHCSPIAQVEVNGTADGSGTATVPVFRGPEPSSDLPWGCFAPGDVAPPGVLAATTCYVRVTNDVVLNNDDAVEVAVGVTGAGDPVDRGVLGAPVAATGSTTPAPSAAPAAPVDPLLVGAPLAFTG